MSHWRTSPGGAPSINADTAATLSDDMTTDVEHQRPGLLCNEQFGPMDLDGLGIGTLPYER